MLPQFDPTVQVHTVSNNQKALPATICVPMTDLAPPPTLPHPIPLDRKWNTSSCFQNVSNYIVIVHRY